MQIKLQNSELRSLATNGKVIAHANEIIKNDCIQDIIFLPMNRILSALVNYPENEYHFVSILLSSNGRPSKFQCTCNHSQKFWGFCAHAMALLLKLNNQELTDYEQPVAAAAKLQKLAAELNKKQLTANTENKINSDPKAPKTLEEMPANEENLSVNPKLAELQTTGSDLLQKLFKSYLLNDLKSNIYAYGTLNYELILSLPRLRNYSSQQCPRLKLLIGDDQLFPVINWWKTLLKRQDGQDIKLAKDFVWRTMLRTLPADIEKFLDDLSENLNEDSIYTIEQRNNSFQDWPLNQNDFLKLVNLKIANPALNIKILDENNEKTDWDIVSSWPNLPINLDLSEENKKKQKLADTPLIEPAYILNVQDSGNLEFINYGLLLFIQGNKFYKLPENLEAYADLLIAITKYFTPNTNSGFADDADSKPLAFTSYQANNLLNILAPVADLIQLKTAPNLVSGNQNSPTPRIWLSFSDGGLEARLRIMYNEDIFFDPQPLSIDKLLKVYSCREIGSATNLRNIKFEIKWLEQLQKAGFQAENEANNITSLLPSTIFKMPFGNNMDLFINRTIPAWTEQGAEFMAEKSMQKLNFYSLSSISGEIKFNTTKNLLEISVKGLNLNSDAWHAILKAYRQNKTFVKLNNVAIISWNQKIADELYPLSCIEDWGGEFKNNQVLLPIFRALPLLYLLNDNPAWTKDEPLSELYQALIAQPKPLNHQFNPEIENTIRQYQRSGIAWLESLSQYHLGGILADDMGLGKTLQALAYISYKKSNEPELQPVLIVSPTSLLYNWVDEIKRFAPHLSCMAIRGIKYKRESEYQNIANFDVIILSYPQIRQDIDLLKDKSFSCIFLDEAQTIKNYRTHTSQSVKQLRATEKFALTGTPIENNLSELWSVFDFLMPGFLYSHKEFQRRFELPSGNPADDTDNAEASGNATNLFSLRYLIKPFILRRLKSEVLTELPPKVETVLTSPLLPEQSKIYQNYLAQARNQLIELTSTSNNPGERISTKHTMEILSLLTRLRQIACHPALFLPNYRGSSGKLELLEEILTTAIAGGHRILIFSQFTSLLAKIKPLLHSLNISFMYIDGNVPPKERTNLVNDFNAGEGEVFLISLKAGGTGLNLTGADTVILMDPWWNPAVEQQATDRSHRLGQQRKVQVYRLIAKDTIEEKIRELQNKKQNLIDQVVISGENVLSHMKPEDLLALFDI